MKVTVVGAGNVGATCANCIAEKDIVNEVVLLDIKEGVSEGKSLDMWQTAPINLYDTRIKGVTNDYAATDNSEVVVITSGLPRKPGMSRDDLISTNAGIVKSVTENVIKHSPNAKIIIVSNPLDVMCYCAFLAAKVDSSKVFGMAGVSGVGISFGADRIFDVLNQLELYPKEAVNGTELMFVNFGDKEASFSMSMLAKVRAAGIRAEIFPDAAKMKKQMSYANAKSVPFVAIVGENEMNEGKAMLKNMETGEQNLVSVEELIAALRN